MAKRNIIVSDLSGNEVTEEDGATVRVTYNGRDEVRTLDVTATEADELLAGGAVTKKRGRKAAAK
jgi:hypothetical protein